MPLFRINIYARYILKFTIFFFVYIFLSATLLAQTGKKVHGIVKDSSQNTLQGASVSLFSFNMQRDTMKTLSNEKGEFVFKNVKANDFKIKVTSVGYADFVKIYHYTDNGDDILIPFVQLSSMAKVLEEVIVTADKTVTIKEDTIEFKADSFKLRPDADVEALLKKIPGVQVDANGNITAYGKSVTKIRVNGKDFFSGDIKTATKELPANIVDLVQVIDDYGDQAAFTGVKDGDPDKIINLKIKKDKNKGYFGRGQIGYGTDERYTVNGSANYFNNNKQISVLANFNNINTSAFSMPGSGSGGISGMMRGGMPDNGTMSSMTTIMNNGDGGFIQSGQASNDGLSRTNSAGINFRDDWGKKISVYGSYTFTDRQTVTLSNSKQTNLFATGNVVNPNNSNKTENKTSHRIFFNTEWRIDSFNQIKISPTFSYSKTNSTTLTDFLFSDNNNVKLNEGTSSDIVNSTQPNISGTILYNHRFGKSGRLFSANLSGGYNTTDEDDDRINNSIFYSPNGGASTNNQHQFITQDNSNPTRSIRFSYIEPITKKKSLEFNYTNSYSLTSNDKQTNLVNNSSSTRLDSLSNIYENTFTYNRIGINYRYNEKKYNYSLGVAAQASEMQGESFISKSSYKKNTFNWFPLARVTYNFSRTRNLSVNYNANISAPSYSQLQPVFDYSNPQYPVIGNPDLKPEFRNSFSARYSNFDFTSGNMLFSNISYSFTKDKVVTNSINSFGNGGGGNTNGAIQETQYLNADDYYTASGFYNFSKPFQNRKYTLTFNGNLNYTNNVSFINTQKNIGKNFVGSQGLNVDVRLSDWLDLGAGANFTYNQTKNSLTPRANTEVRTYTISSNGKIYLPAKFVLNYDLNKSFNSGYGVSANPFIINGYLERQFSKSNQLSVRLQAFDLLNQNTSISRTVSANSITDTRTNRLGQYFMLSFNFRLQKFKGQQPKTQFPSGPPPEGITPQRF
jgi:Outer membrane protein beta-barrel family/Carboxypeptidase regulatory-like domain